MAFVVREKYELPNGFVCPHCHRNFSTIASCERHLVARRHSTVAATRFCDHDHSSLRRAIRQETMRFAGAELVDSLAPYAAVALLQGKKKYMEDYVVVHRHHHAARRLTLYAVMDGHLGTGAAEYVRAHLVDTFLRRVEAFSVAVTGIDEKDRNASERMAMRQLFLELHVGFLASTSQPPPPDEDSHSHSDSHDFSGCTLTLVVHLEDEQRLVSANVGDSRAILVAGDDHYYALSQDHWPNDAYERRRIESSGGFVSWEGLWRVVGQLAVSRSIGDRHLRQYVTAEPSIFSVNLQDLPSHAPISLVLASDGVWDTMETLDVVQFVRDKPQRSKTPSQLASDLVQEAFLRGSLDNLAVLLVQLQHNSHETQ